MTTNLRQMVNLLREDYTTVSVGFNSVPVQKPVKMGMPAPDTPWQSPPQPSPQITPQPVGTAYTYKVWNDIELEAGDLILVNAAGTLKVATVIEVHATPKIDVNSSIDYKWIIQKVDTHRHDVATIQDEEFLQALLEVERVKMREQMLEDFKKTIPEGSLALGILDGAVQSLNSKIKTPKTVFNDEAIVKE